MFSMQDIIKMMGPNTASYTQMSDQLGTPEQGKIADLILLDGNPSEGYWNLLKSKLYVPCVSRLPLLKGGRLCNTARPESILRKKPSRLVR